MNRAVLARRLVRELNQQRGRVVAIAAVIAIGTMLAVGLRGAHHDLKSARDHFYVAQRMADVWIRLKRAPRRQALASARRYLRSAQGRIVEEARLVPPNGQDTTVSVLVVSLPAPRRPLVNDIYLTAGRYFQGGLREEAIVGRAFAREHGIQPGDRLRLIVGGRIVSVRVVGIALSPEFVYLLAPGSIVPDPARYGVVFLPEAFMERATGLRGAITELVGRLKGRTLAERVASLRALERKLDPYGVLSVWHRTQQPSHRYLSDEIRGLGVFGVVFPALFLIAAVLVLHVILWRQVDQERPVLGVLKSLGYPDSHVAAYYAGHALVVVLLGALVGLLGGIALHHGMMRVYREFFELPHLRASWQPVEYGLAFGVALLTAASAASRAVWLAWRLPPAAAMRPSPESASRQVRPLPRNWPMGVRVVVSYLLRRPLRSAAGVLAVALAGSMLTVGLLSYDSTLAVLDYQYRRAERHDWSVWLRDYRSHEAEHEVARETQGVISESMAVIPVTVRRGPHQKDSQILLLPRHPRLFVPWPGIHDTVTLPGRGVALSRRLAMALGVRAGDWIAVQVKVGQRRRVRLRVVRLVDDYLGVSLYAAREMAPRLLGHVSPVNRVLLRHARQPGQRLAEHPSVATVRNRRVERDLLWKLVTELTLTYVALLIGFAAALLFSSLFNVLAVSLIERRRDYATLMALGFRPGEIVRMLAGELSVLVGFGLVFTFPLGIGLTAMLIRLYNTDYFRMPLVVRLSAVVTVALTAAVCGTAVWAIVARQVVRANWLDWLRTRE